MEKQDVKNILMSMRTPQNSILVNRLLGKIDMLNEESFQNALEKVGNNEEGVRSFFEKKLAERQQNQDEKKYPINDMFTYGISGDCVHLHLPVNLKPIIAEKGISATMDIVNLKMLDAIDKIKELRDNGFYRLQGINNIYMISPILYGRGLKFFESMDFQTASYRKKQLSDEQFLESNSEAQLATELFGKDKNIGSAIISFDTISTDEWQSKKNNKIAEFAEKGIVLQEQESPDKKEL